MARYWGVGLVAAILLAPLAFAQASSEQRCVSFACASEYQNGFDCDANAGPGHSKTSLAVLTLRASGEESCHGDERIDQISFSSPAGYATWTNRSKEDGTSSDALVIGTAAATLTAQSATGAGGSACNVRVATIGATRDVSCGEHTLPRLPNLDWGHLIPDYLP